MRLVELIGCTVIDANGNGVGAVHDVRLVAEGPTDANGRHAYLLDALVVGDGGAAHRLGYSDDEVRGPWPLTAIFRRLARRSVLVPWTDVASFDRPNIRIRSTRQSLPTLADLPQSER